MKKIFAAFFVIAIFVTIAYYGIIVVGIGAVIDFVDDTENDIDVAKELIGERFVIEKDTLTITDYSLVDGYSVYGRNDKFSKEFVEKNLIPSE